MAGTAELVIGASGLLGSHVTRQLAQRGDRVRVLLRPTSSKVAIDDLEVERHFGDVFDDVAVRAAMDGCDDVYYCVVDARAWLRDPAPLFRTNVEDLRHVLDAAVCADLRRFVFTSTIGTIALSENGAPVTEEEPFNWAGVGGGYIGSRVAAEELVLEYARDRGLPAVMYALGFGGDVAATVLRRDMLLSTQSVLRMHIMSPMDHGKAERELGWHPQPVHDAIRRAVEFYLKR